MLRKRSENLFRPGGDSAVMHEPFLCATFTLQRTVLLLCNHNLLPQ